MCDVLRDCLGTSLGIPAVQVVSELSEQMFFFTVFEITMGGADHCTVYMCHNDRGFKDK